MATLSDVIHETAVRNFTLRLSSTPRGARLARLLAVEQLRAWGLPLDPARQLVAELAANAVTHGRVPGRDFQLTLYAVADTLRIEVTDTRGDRSPCLEGPAGDAESGRGLVVVEALADRWGVALERHPRKTVWAELNTGAPASTFLNSGATGGLSHGTRERKNPYQAPPLPPAACPHSGE
ncbi:ATP-binding protein [Streptomyces sp. V3I7]|uniref:ATP-binding protein n=1 Tax=Streptomyces sp. V3I7 TaxID=3042278 RepID=UPI002786C907|nr:ATP-binding protein [Streptomyces sp. V3I7]MDQ0992877.1 anti-sigma regulatory factor (Ser/Thr protein kinase) [Streptomyces sp. V3I7]